jgi:hypothetical protein
MSLQATLTKPRLEKSLQVRTDGNTNPTVANGGGALANYVNNTVPGAFQSKPISAYDRLPIFTVAASYLIPKRSYLKKASNCGSGSWHCADLVERTADSGSRRDHRHFEPVVPGPLMDRVPGVPLHLVPRLNCHCCDPSATPVLNPAALVNPPAGQFGTAPPFYDNFRCQRHPAENINLARTWRFETRMSLKHSRRVLHRRYYNNPTATNPTTPATRNALGNLTGGYGRISTVLAPTNQLAQPRNGTVVTRFSF